MKIFYFHSFCVSLQFAPFVETSISPLCIWHPDSSVIYDRKSASCFGCQLHLKDSGKERTLPQVQGARGVAPLLGPCDQHSTRCWLQLDEIGFCVHALKSSDIKALPRFLGLWWKAMPFSINKQKLYVFFKKSHPPRRSRTAARFVCRTISSYVAELPSGICSF